MCRRVLKASAGLFHCVLTNVPGPSERIAWAGQDIHEIVGAIPQPGGPNSIGASIYSYAGGVSVSTVMCRDPEGGTGVYANGAAQRVCECFEESLGQLGKKI